MRKDVPADAAGSIPVMCGMDDVHRPGRPPETAKTEGG
jgi:hypothetical protein